MTNFIRNFVIIAHINHGKSTLADRFLELTGTIEKRKMRPQFLDRMELERERGITIKMQPVRMLWHPEGPERSEGQEYILNLIDTPGHVDFSYEVSRALAAVEGAVLLVDAAKGIQAQSVAHLTAALEQNLLIIPVINKIDLQAARTNEVEEEIVSLMDSLNYKVGKIYKISARTGEGVEELLAAIIEQVPPPAVDREAPLRALIFDSIYDDYRGVISFVRLIDGAVASGDSILFMASSTTSIVKEVGIFSPDLTAKPALYAGDIGYIVSGVKDMEFARIGDTITFSDEEKIASVAIKGYKQPQSLVFSTVFPTNKSNYDDLHDAFNKLKLNDASLYFEQEHSSVLGRGFKVGYLGMLHMEIILERLRREYGLELIIGPASVAYNIKMNSGKELFIFSPDQYPDPASISEVGEPWVLLKILVPASFMNNVMKLLKTIRGVYKDTDYIGKAVVRVSYEAPLADIISDFYDNLKNVTSGFGSLSYEIIGYRTSDIAKLDILLAGEKAEALSRLVPRSRIDSEARRLVEKIKNILPAEQFTVAIQAVVGGKIIARETKTARRKNVTGNLYGGDITRKKKLLEKQKKGKKRMRDTGRVRLDADILIKLSR